jgi:hypothetical protein
MRAGFCGKARKRLRVFENKVLGENGGEDRKLEKTAQSEATSLVLLTAFGLSNQGDCDVGKEKFVGYRVLVKKRERKNLEDLGVNGRIKFIWILNKLDQRGGVD